ncbi:MAG: two-component regulator propeller domain-containing protein [Bacteroidota bacterium]
MKITKQFLNYFLILEFLVFISCNTSEKKADTASSLVEPAVVHEETDTNTFSANAVTEIRKSINCIFQDKHENYWFATNGDGVYRYSDKSLIRFTEKDGLCNDYVGTIQEDDSGNIWFGTSFGVSKFDGRTFTTFVHNESLQLNNILKNEWKIESGDLLFPAGEGFYRYHNNAFTYLLLPRNNADAKYLAKSKIIKPYLDPLGRYWVYCTLKDRKGNIWFGTQTLGVCRFDGKLFTWFYEKGLSPPAVRGLFEDKNGNMWFGNNGYGLFRYDGKSLINFTEEKGLSNPEFLSNSKASGKPGPGTLARVWTINEDIIGNIWIGTIDAGAWRYDGTNLVNFTMKDGLTSNSINTIYKDKKGELWFGTDGGGVCKFNGTTFTKFVAK